MQTRHISECGYCADVTESDRTEERIALILDRIAYGAARESQAGPKINPEVVCRWLHYMRATSHPLPPEAPMLAKPPGVAWLPHLEWRYIGL